MSPGQDWIDGLLEQLEATEQAERAAKLRLGHWMILRRGRRENPRGEPQPLPDLPERPAPTGAPLLPSLAGGLRGAPATLTASPPPPAPAAKPTPWWRRWRAAAGGLAKRLERRRQRITIHRYYPDATWAQCHEAARLAMDKRVGVDSLAGAFAEAQLWNYLATMGRALPGFPIQPGAAPTRIRLGVAGQPRD